MLKEADPENSKKALPGKSYPNGPLVLLPVVVVNKLNNKNALLLFQDQNHVKDLKSWRDHATNNLALILLKSLSDKRSTQLF